MTNLAAQFQELVNQGVLKPSVVAPRFEQMFVPETIKMKTAYNIGEALIRDGEKADAKLESGSQRNPNAERYAP